MNFNIINIFKKNYFSERHVLVLNKMEAERMKLIYIKYVLVVKKEKEEGARKA